MTTLRRQLKNVVKNYTEAEVKVREATSNDPWGPSSTLMSEISDLTYNIVALGDIMRMIWKRLNDHGKNWRHVYKSLVLLDYLIKNGNEKVAQQCKEHVVAIQTLKDFQYMEENKDQGASVRDKAKQLVSLLRDEDRLKQERIKAHKARERYAQNAMGISSDNKLTYSTPTSQSVGGGSRYMGGSLKTGGNYNDPYGGARGLESGDFNMNGTARSNSVTGNATAGLSPDLEAVRPSDPSEEELQVNLALMLSQQEHEEEVQRKRADEAKLQLAIEQSRFDNNDKSKDHGLLDLATGGSDDAYSDPWNENRYSNNSNNNNSSLKLPPPPLNSHLHQLPSKQQTNSDPWSLNHSNNTNGGLTKLIDDPWSVQTTNSHFETNNSNPWNSTSPPATVQMPTASLVDPWATNTLPPSNKTQNSNNLDDFDIFTSKRAISPLSTIKSSNNDPFGDFFGGTPQPQPSLSTTNPWGGNNSTTTTSSNDILTTKLNNNNNAATRKTPESFLGENSSLVNLDNLISTRPKSTNPFGNLITQTSSSTITPPPQLSNVSLSLSNNNLNSMSKTLQTSNPFMQTQKGPTINQLSMQQQGSFGGGGFAQTQNNNGGGGFLQLSQPLIIPPQTNAFNSFNNQTATTNPFLM